MHTGGLHPAPANSAPSAHTLPSLFHPGHTSLKEEAEQHPDLVLDALQADLFAQFLTVVLRADERGSVHNLKAVHQDGFSKCNLSV